MKVFAFALTIALSAATIQGHTAELNNETVPGVISKMVDITKKMKSLEGELPGLATTTSNATKKAGLWKEQLADRIQPKIDVHIEKSKVHVAKEKRLTNEINRHNSACTGEKPKPVYDKCKSEEAVLKKLSADHYAEKDVLKKERASLSAEWDKYSALYNEELAVIKQDDLRRAKIKAELVKYNQRLEYYRSRLITLCAQADKDGDGEALHHCQSISWDGTRKSLPPLDQILRGTKFFGR